MCHLGLAVCLFLAIRVKFLNNISKACFCWNFTRKFCGTKHNRTDCYEATGLTVCPFISAEYKMWAFREVFHNSLLVAEVFRLPTLTPISGFCYCSCLPRTALSLPGTFSFAQMVWAIVCVCTLASCIHLQEIYFTGQHAMYCLICLCTVYI